MTHTRSLFVWILAAALTSACAAAEPLVKIQFPGGRIAYSADGNLHDKDDFGATALSCAMVSSAGLANKLVHYDYSCHLGKNSENQDKQMIESALGGAKRFGLDEKRFFNDQTQLDEAIENFKIEGNKSTEKDPLWFICAGPMEVPWRCISAVDPEKRKYIYCISHSPWNDRHSDTPEMNHRWEDLGKLGAKLIHIDNQNKTGFNCPQEEWYWLRDSDHENWQWLFSRNVKNSFDVSDSGMMFWLITGGPEGGNMNGGPAEMKYLLENPVTSARIAGKPFVETDGLVVMEAEATQSELGQWIRKTDNAGFTGDGHLEFTGNTINGGKPDSSLVYPFTVKTEGDWQLLIRCQKRLEGAAGDKCNDGYVRVEGTFTPGENGAPIDSLTKDTKFFGGVPEGWAWASKLDDHKKYNPIYHFRPGDYTLIVSGRSIRWNIDRIVFRHTTAASEDDAKNPETPQSPRAQ